jgi:hypothetical protein
VAQIVLVVIILIPVSRMMDDLRNIRRGESMGAKATTG